MNTVVRTISLTGLTAALFGTNYGIEVWAAEAFARPIMGAALVAVIQVGVLLLFLLLASPLAALICLMLKVPRD